MRNHFFPRMLFSAAALFSVLFWTGCGDTFRPVVNPITPPGGTPQNLSSVNVISQGVTVSASATSNPIACTTAPCAGSASLIDASGDTDNTDIVVGRNPIYGALSGSGTVFVVNSTDESLSSYVPFSSTAGTTVSMPTGSKPVLVGGTESGFVYAALSGTNAVGVVNASASPPTLTATVSVGTAPVALAELPNQQKVYVANSGSGNVSVIQPSSQATPTVSTTIALSVSGAVPIWVTAKPDNSAIYVLDQSGAVYVINTITETNTSTVNAGKRPPCNANGTPCGFMHFDSTLQRLYVTNPTDGTISAFDTSQSDSAGNPLLVPICPAGVSSCTTSAIAVSGLATPTSLTVPKGSGRVYVIGSGSNSVTVLDATSLTVKSTIPVGPNPVSIASSADGSKVYVANNGVLNADGTVAQMGSTSVIATSTDSVITTIRPPFQDPTCTSDTAGCPRNAPVWVVGY